MTVQTINQLATEIKMTGDEEIANSTLSSWFRNSWRGCVAEFLTTTMLLLFACMTCIPIEGINMTIYTPFGFGLVAMFIIQIFGHISGAYMNPAVTTAAVIWGHISIPVGIAYALSQITGALVGYGILSALSPVDMVTEAVCVTTPHVDLTGLQAVGVEAALTAGLVFINCGIWDPVNANDQDSAPIKFGLTVTALSLAGGPLTSSSLNPARSLAPALWTGSWTHLWIYWTGPFIGSIIAVVFYKTVFLKKRSVD